ncbi:MAG TPA: M23 family metallopeptidase [Bacteroidales bacterium]|nr:M23 family metallopeptidase [Bacteroidales bacterium]
MHFSKTLFLLLFTIVLGVTAQDNYTVNIRYGRNAAALDSVITNQLEEEEEQGDLYEGLYGSWSNSAVNPYGMNIGNMKDSFYINIANYYPPVLGKVTSNFGVRGRRGFHNGIDLRVKVGDTIRAAFNGRVRVRQFNRRGYGYYIVLRNHEGIETIYAHLSRFLVAPNQDVKAGEPIGLGGNTGRSTGPHLHFETRIFGNPINPAKLFSFEDYVPLHKRYFIAKAKTFEERIKYSGGVYFGVHAAPVGPDMANRSNAKTYQKGEYASVKFHTVRKGESLYRIANENGISLADLCKLNNIKPKTSIRPGQRLRLS